MTVSVKTYDFTIPAGGAFQVQAVGSYFRIQTTTGPVRVQGEFGDLSPLSAGQGIKDSPFTRLNLTNLSAFAITGSVIVADKEFVDQQMVLSGSVQSSSIPLINIYTTDVTVTSNVVNLCSARVNRRYLLIQNKSTTGTVWISLSGTTPVVGLGVCLPPGASFEQDNGAFTNQIYAIGDIASNPSVLVVEGW